MHRHSSAVPGRVAPAPAGYPPWIGREREADSYPGARRREMGSTMRISAERRHDVTILTPIGHLDLRSYPQLRDAMLRHAADVPAALVVDLDRMDVRPGRTGSAPLSVFTTVWRRLEVWPEIPLRLACARQPLAGLLRAGTVSRSVPTHRSVDEALAALGDPPLRRRAERVVAVATVGAGPTRRWISEVLHRWGVEEELVEDAVLVGSELVENMVRHARTGGAIHLELRGSGLSIAVSDGSARRPQIVAADAATVLGGRGLAVVDQIARAWGHHERARGGKVVWAVLHLPGHG